MQPFLVINRHAPEECDAMGAHLDRLPPHLEGKRFLCPCPFGEHAFYLEVEGRSAADVIQRLPPEWRSGSRAVAIEVYDL